MVVTKRDVAKTKQKDSDCFVAALREKLISREINLQLGFTLKLCIRQLTNESLETLRVYLCCLGFVCGSYIMHHFV